MNSRCMHHPYFVLSAHFHAMKALTTGAIVTPMSAARAMKPSNTDMP